MSATPRGNLLFADDDDSVLRPTSEALRCAGFEVDSVNTAREVQDALSARNYDAVLVDINMPGNEQLQLVRELSAIQTSSPIVILTGFPSLETAVDALRLGVVDYITKPAKLDELFERLDRAVQRGRLLRTLHSTEEQVAQLSTWLTALKGAVHHGIPFREKNGSGSDRSRGSGEGDPLRNLRRDELEQLSRREREVLATLAAGHPAQEIAELLGLSTNTVRNHLKSIFLKLRVNSQVALLAKLAKRDTS